MSQSIGMVYPWGLLIWIDTIEPDKDWPVTTGVSGRKPYWQFVRQMLGMLFTSNETDGFADGVNRKIYDTGLKITLVEYGRVSVEVILGDVPALPPVMPLKVRAISSTLPEYSK